MALDRSLRQYRTGFVLVDVAAVLCAFLLAHVLRHGAPLSIPEPYLWALPYVALVFLFAFRSMGAYETRRGGIREMVQIAAGVGAGLAGTLALSFFYRGFSYSRLVSIFFAILAFVLVLHFRYLYRAILDLMFGQSQWLKRVLVVGDCAQAKLLLEELRDHKSDYIPLGVLVATTQGRPSERYGVPVLGTLDEIDDVIERLRPDMTIIADPTVAEGDQARIIETCLDRDIHWKIIPRIPAPADQEVGLSVVAGLALLGSKGNNITGFNYLLKRIVDVAAAGALLVLLSPLMAGVAIGVKLLSKGPVLFVQERVGYRAKAFRFYKFRSMHVSSDDSIHREYVKKWINGGSEAELQDGRTVVHKLTRDPRVIPWIGWLIRKFSIDELPQLFNVIKGDMSLVGPRPCLPYEVELYKRNHRMRFDVLPGITGLWQVSGRNRLTFDQMVALDIRYLQNWSIGLDLAIMAKTPYIVFFDKAY
jgi:exopolysaccharide biosynthesis polyprenyl glycosylphosphotransferase